MEIHPESVENFKQWIEDNREILKPPVGNKCVYEDTEFIIMVVGGPNSRKDYHFDEGEEFFYQIEGDITLKVIENGTPKDIKIKNPSFEFVPKKYITKIITEHGVHDYNDFLKKVG